MNSNNKNIASVLLLFLSFFSANSDAQKINAQKINGQAIAKQYIAIKNAYIRETLPGNHVSSAYMTLINHSDKTIKLISISSDFSPRIEIHAHTMKNGMMKMERLDAISIKANAKVLLQPYGLHLMIFDLQQPLKDGQKVSLTLHFAQHENITITVPVISIKKKRS